MHYICTYEGENVNSDNHGKLSKTHFLPFFYFHSFYFFIKVAYIGGTGFHLGPLIFVHFFTYYNSLSICNIEEVKVKYNNPSYK